MIMDNSIVKDYAEVKGQVFVMGKSMIFGRAIVQPVSRHKYLQLYNANIRE
jgi:hypothetical protein